MWAIKDKLYLKCCEAMEELQAGVRHELEGSKVKWVDQLGGCGNSPGER